MYGGSSPNIFRLKHGISADSFPVICKPRGWRGQTHWRIRNVGHDSHCTAQIVQKRSGEHEVECKRYPITERHEPRLGWNCLISSQTVRLCGYSKRSIRYEPVHL